MSYTVCAQAILFFDILISKKCANQIFLYLEGILESYKRFGEPLLHHLGHLQLICSLTYFIKITIYTCGITPQYQQRSLFAQARLFTLPPYPRILPEVTIFPARFFYCLVLACIKAIIHIRLFSFCYDRATYNRKPRQVLRFFTIIKFKPIPIF